MENNSLLCAIPARVNDELIFAARETSILRPAQLLLSRAIALTVFPLLATLDAAHHFTRSFAYRVCILCLGDQNEKYQEALIYHRDLYQRCLIGVLFSLTSLLCSDIVTQHFVPANKIKGVFAPYGGLYSQKCEEFWPESMAEVQWIVKQASLEGKKIAIAGAGLSQGKQALPADEEQWVIHMRKVNSVEIDLSEKKAVVGAGATWGDIQDKANRAGLAVRVAQASNPFQVGGSLGINCHGWDHHSGTLAETVKKITIVNAQGELQELTREDELFGYVIGGLGGFGVIVCAELDLAYNRYLEVTPTEVTPEEYLAHFNTKVRNNPETEMHLYRLSLDPKELFKTGIAVDYKQNGAPEGFGSSYLPEEPTRGNRLERIALHITRRVALLHRFIWRFVKADALTQRRMMRCEIMRPSINPIFNHSIIDCEWLQEYFVPEESLNQFLPFLAKKLTENNVLVMNASVRFVKHDRITKMGYANGGDRFAIVLFFRQSLQQDKIKQTEQWYVR